MKKSLVTKILVICFLVLGLSLSAFGCSNNGVSDAKAVLEAYERYAESETKLFSDYKFEIQFAPNIKTAISGMAYDANGALVTTHSHFEVLNKYKEIATKSTVMFVNWRNLLKTQNDNITKRQATALYQKFVEFKSACKNLSKAVDDINYWDGVILRDGNVNSSSILNTHLRILKDNYGTVIQKAFAMTNEFLKIYDSLIISPDFINDSTATLKNGDIELTADHFIVEVLDAAFELDGVQFSLYEDRENDNCDIYSETVDKVLNSIAVYNSIDKSRLEVEDYSEAKKAEVEKALRLYQINLVSYNQQKELFLKLTPEVDYADYRQTMKEMKAANTENKSDAELHNEYLTALAEEDTEQVAKFMFVHDFVRTDLLNVISSFNRLLNAINTVNKA